MVDMVDLETPTGTEVVYQIKTDNAILDAMDWLL